MKANITEATFAKYAADNADAAGRVYEVTLTDDVDVEARISRSTWEDGVPVTKQFERNDPVDLHIPAGQKIKGVTYVGRASGCAVFDFPYGQAWYSCRGSDAQAFGIVGDGNGCGEE
jgi:hypothetical protein